MDIQVQRINGFCKTIKPEFIENHNQDSKLVPSTPQTSSLPSLPINPDDVVIVSALRTPMGKAKKGVFKDSLIEDLLTPVFRGILDETEINPKDIGEVCVGNVLDVLAVINARKAQFFSGIPEDVPVYTTNRQCASGLMAFINVAAFIKSGIHEIGIAAGVESMTHNDFKDVKSNPKMRDCKIARDLLLGVGIPSEIMSERFDVTRDEQDRFAYNSQMKAKYAHESGRFKDEMVPVTTNILDTHGQESIITVTRDEGIRETTMEGLRDLKPASKIGGTVTAGNVGRPSDGAAGVLVMTRREAVKRCYPILGILRSFAVRGCPPDIMGVGPAVAIPLALEKAELSSDDVSVFEINEEFAGQVVYCVRQLNIPMERVNPNGGAIALGHPLGCSGVRQIVTLLHELKRRGKRSFGVVSMCVGSGQGAAAVFEYPGGNL